MKHAHPAAPTSAATTARWQFGDPAFSIVLAPGVDLRAVIDEANGYALAAKAAAEQDEAMGKVGDASSLLSGIACGLLEAISAHVPDGMRIDALMGIQAAAE